MGCGRSRSRSRCCSSRPRAFSLSSLLCLSHHRLGGILFNYISRGASLIRLPFRFCSFVDVGEEEDILLVFIYQKKYNAITPNDLHWVPCTCLRSSDPSLVLQGGGRSRGGGVVAPTLPPFASHRWPRQSPHKLRNREAIYTP